MRWTRPLRLVRSLRIAALALAPLVCIARALAAQTPPPVAVRGIAYDSVASRPLGGAFITLNGVRTTFADERGSFTFDSVEAGTHLFEMTHAALDSMGLPGVAARVRVSDGLASITLAVPSFTTLWRAACGSRGAPADSGFVYGTVRSALDGASTPLTRVELSWSDLKVLNIRTITGKRYIAETESDANGEYSVCGIPLDAGMRLQARRTGLASAQLDVLPGGLRVIRRDLLLAPSDTANATARGTITGSVTHAQGGAFEGATVVLDDVPQARSAADGRFLLPNVIAGTHQVEVLGIGAKPQLFVVDVFAGQVATITASLERVTRLDEVRIIGSPWQVRLLEGIEERTRSGFGRVMDSTVTAKRASMSSVYAGMGGVTVTTGRTSQDFNIMMKNGDGDPCTPRISIDGVESDIEFLRALLPSDIALTEVYARPATIPISLQRGIPGCGLIVVWTRRYMP